MRRAVASFLVLFAPMALGANAPATRPANRLANEKSPYLLQHAHNPVDWYPWGKEAFEKAKREGKPVLLSVGYSTCHWCHVMERESFEDASIAKLMNEHFVCVKVDREERPDVDRIYMTFVQATTGGGGWPMTVFLTPEGKPFYGGTYFPPVAKQGMIAFPDLLTKVHGRWVDDRERILKSADAVTEALKEFAAPKADPLAKAEQAALDKAFKAYEGEFDAARGGLKDAPKFPQPSVWKFILTYHARTGNAAARDMTLRTLRAMADGGIHDHLGGGFHRYATDAEWFLPHFEKMLYDQAQVAGLYLDAYQITKDRFYADVARDVFEYVLRDLRGKEGQLYSAEDADSVVDPAKPAEKSEGAFYVWDVAGVERLLGKADAEVFAFAYGMKDEGNVARDPHQEFTKKNVLFRAKSDEAVAEKIGRPIADVRRVLAEGRSILFEARKAKPRPHLDDKTLVAWNGLMISALARGGVVLDESKYSQAAVDAAAFVRERLYDAKTHELKRRYREGSADVPAFADDYAFFIAGLIDLYETTLDAQWLRLAIDLQGKQDELFWDEAGGGYFSTTAGSDVLMRMKEQTDGAEASANSVSAMNLLRLSQMLDDAKMRGRAERTINSVSELMNRSPVAMPNMLASVDFHSAKAKQVVIAGKSDAPDVRAMLREVHSHHLPRKVILGADGGEGQKFLAQRAKFMEFVQPLGGKATAYVCENYVCQEPTGDVARLREQLKK